MPTFLPILTTVRAHVRHGSVLEGCAGYATGGDSHLRLHTANTSVSPTLKDSDLIGLGCNSSHDFKMQPKLRTTAFRLDMKVQMLLCTNHYIKF